MIGNPLFDVDFLTKLASHRNRETFARITALTLDERPIELIEGKVTGGSVNVDGNSAVRRTCSLTMIAKDININEYYWGLKNKFKLEIGVKNKINPKYPDIIWFKQGLFIITSFNTSQSTNNFTINISGKDKMCLINGDLGGALPSSVDFGIEEYHDKVADTVTYTSIPIKTIIREAVQNYGNELARNIIINDIEDAGLELLEYRGNTPIYMFRQINSDQFINMTLNKNQTCYINGHKTYVGDETNITYDNLVDLEGEEESTTITLSEGGQGYKVAKFEYGSIPGYRLTDLTFAGDLIANVGETVTSVLDKIKNMLGEFEYFYNIDGKFVFQKKKYYIDAPWNATEADTEVYADSAIINNSPVFSFTQGNLVTAFQNNPNLLNLRNDYIVWGTYKTTGGTELPIHMRYAIDKKPYKYMSLNNILYTTDKELAQQSGGQYVDWREIIYQMALDYRKHYHDDDFLIDVAIKNPQYETGRTGYEQYYTDLEGFWRDLYNPNPEIAFCGISYTDIPKYNDSLYVKNAFRKVKADDKATPQNTYVFQNGTMYPFIGSSLCCLQSGSTYFYRVADGSMNQGTNSSSLLNQVSLEYIYIKNEENYSVAEGQLYTNDGKIFKVYQHAVKEDSEEGMARFIDACFEKHFSNLYIKDEGYLNYSELDNNVKTAYNYKEYVSRYKYKDNYGTLSSDIIVDKIYYNYGFYEFHNNPAEANYWSKAVTDEPESLFFWFDFLDAENSDLAKYSVPVIGARTKSINDKDVKTIYYREIPKTIFQTNEETYEHQTGYTYIQLQPTMENLFTISSKGKSAKERIDELLYNHSYCIENVTITAIPVFHLEPNYKILVRDEKSQIDGEYIVSKLTIPLAYNGTMSITATKAVSNIN